MKKAITFTILCFGFIGFSQSKLDNYIQTGLKSNEVIKQHNFDINKSMYALQEARSLFYPTVSLNANYTKADGGRTIDIPIGDMLNPVYSTLNQIDNFFLTMEGLGQYAMYAWLKHPKGANLPAEQVIAGVRRGKKQWSQEEGFALFLLLEKYSPASKWAPAMFGTKTESVTDLILNKIN